MKKRTGWMVACGTVVAWLALLAVSAAGGDRPARWEEGSGLTEPKAVEKAPPDYPEAARADKVQGVVVLEVTIETKGDVADIEAIEDPDSRLTAAARDAVARWRFEPARDADGRAVAVRYRLTVAFKLS